METYYDCFVRTWWRENPEWPDGLEPCPGKKRYIARHVTWRDACEICKRWNDAHEPGRLSRKAEFEGS